MIPTITAFKRSPDGGRGLARDMRIRWALEEVGAQYKVRLISFAALKSRPHMALHPFGQIPTFEDDGVKLFESGAIVLHIAEKFGGLLPDDVHGRARAIAWMFAALNTVEAPIVEREQAAYNLAGKVWRDEYLAMLDANVTRRLGQLADRVGESDWLEVGGFTAGDLLMVSVLMRAQPHTVGLFPNLVAYIARGQGRPAYQRAFAAQFKINRPDIAP